jgi:hypothetical protein
MAEQLKADDVRKTYRYLRIGMIGAVVLLATSIVVERSKVDCWQTSISAYYYTPVRAIFVGSMIAVGLSLIVYKGRGGLEDFFLNFAGMLAPVVAIAPTMDAERQCWSFPPTSFPIQNGSVAEWVTTNIDNNFYALLIAGGMGLAVAAIIAISVNRRSGARSILAPFEKGERGTRLGLIVTALVLLFGWWLIENWGDFNRLAHGYAAVGMFGFLIAAIIANVLEQYGRRDRKWSRRYLIVAGLMILGGIVIPAFRIGNEYTVGVLEAYEIVFFAVYWIAQTSENWNEEVQRRAKTTLPSVGSLAWADREAVN